MFSEVIKAAQSIEDANTHAVALSTVALALAQAGQFGEAFFVLLPLELYLYLEFIDHLIPLLEKLKAGLSVAVVGEVVRIITWLWPQWRKIHDILTTSR